MLNSAGRLRFKGKSPGESSAGRTWVTAHRAWPERAIQNTRFQQLPPLTRLSSSYFIQNARQNSSQNIQLEKKKNQEIEMQRLHEVSLHRYLLPACTIPLSLFVSESSKETEQQRTQALMLTGKHPENKTTEISGNFRTSCAKIIYQVHIGGTQAEV